MSEMTMGEEPALVTGASGFIGRHLVRALLTKNRRVIGICRRPRDMHDLKHPLFQVIPGDLGIPDNYRQHLSGESTVFHLAAVRSGPGTSSERMRDVNVEACLELGRAATRARVARFVYVSTALVYGASQDRSVTETDGYSARMGGHDYVQSKLQAVCQMKPLIEDGLPLVTVYPAIVFGPDHSSHPNRVTSHLRRLLRSGVDLVIGGGHQRRSLVYVDDVVRGILLAERLGSVGEDFILSGEDISHRELNRNAFLIAGRKPKLKISLPAQMALATARAADRFLGYDRGSGYRTAMDVLTREWRYGSTKAERMLGYSWTPVLDGLRQTLQFIESRG